LDAGTRQGDLCASPREGRTLACSSYGSHETRKSYGEIWSGGQPAQSTSTPLSRGVR
jgi:hypothetical protein